MGLVPLCLPQKGLNWYREMGKKCPRMIRGLEFPQWINRSLGGSAVWWPDRGEGFPEHPIRSQGAAAPNGR